MSDEAKIRADALLYGTGYSIDGKHIPFDSVRVAPPTPPAHDADKIIYCSACKVGIYPCGDNVMPLPEGLLSDCPASNGQGEGGVASAPSSEHPPAHDDEALVEAMATAALNATRARAGLSPVTLADLPPDDAPAWRDDARALLPLIRAREQQARREGVDSERERCAKVADEAANAWRGVPFPSETLDNHVAAAETIAAAIRGAAQP